MKHADADALDRLEDLLQALRSEPGAAALREKQRGVFYHAGKAFLHFHTDPVGLFADLRTGAAFERFLVDTPLQRQALLAAVHASLGAGDGGGDNGPPNGRHRG